MNEAHSNVDTTIELLSMFKTKLIAYHKEHEFGVREWLNQNVHLVRNEVLAAGCLSRLTLGPPPFLGGAVLKNVEPFSCMFEAPYELNVAPKICDMIDRTIGVLRNPPAARGKLTMKAAVQKGYAFIAMAIDEADHQLVDVHQTIKRAAASCGVTAERVDEVESNERITDRILQSIAIAEFVIVDITNERPNVFYEAGYAHGMGKLPIYVAREGTPIHFDIHDYQIIMFRNMAELERKLRDRLVALKKRVEADPS